MWLFLISQHSRLKNHPEELSFRRTMMTPAFVLLHFSLTVKAATLIFISGCASAISSAKEGKSGFIYNLEKSK